MELSVNFYSKLRECESSIKQIAADAGISRQQVHNYSHGALPSRKAFTALCALDKYAALREFDFDELRATKPVGRPKNKPA